MSGRALAEAGRLILVRHCRFESLTFAVGLDSLSSLSAALFHVKKDSVSAYQDALVARRREFVTRDGREEF